jgi:hypothetical protein
MGHRLQPKILATTGSLQWETVGEPYTPYRIWPHHSGLKRRGTNLKRSNFGSSPCLHFSTLRWAWARRISPPVCLSHLPPRLRARPGPPIKHARRLSATNKHWQPEASWSGGLSHLARRHVATGTHACLTTCTQVLNHSLRRLTY